MTKHIFTIKGTPQTVRKTLNEMITIYGGATPLLALSSITKEGADVYEGRNNYTILI